MNSPYRGKFRVSQQFKGLAHDGLDLVGVDSKQIHSTVNGVVEHAGWENPLNKKQGFGIYIRIKQENSVDRYYYGHLSKVLVKYGDKVKIGDVIGIEGSTGRSTGSHCHYCVRANCSRAEHKDIVAISGIPNKIGRYEDNGNIAEKTVSQLAKEVIAGKWGNGAERKQKLTAAGYSYTAVQKEVNRILKGNTQPKKTNQAIAKEVIKGLWGNGAERKKRLTEAGYNYSEIQKIVNELL